MESTPPSRRALGRGLAALIPGAESASKTDPVDSGLRQLPIERIEPNPHQPRKTFESANLEELAASIRTHGILQPIVVRRVGESYQIVAGERRWRAAAQAGLLNVPVLIKDLAASDVLAVALVENIQREDLDPLEEADAYRRLIEEYNLTHDQIAERVGKSRASVSNAIRLLRLPPPLLGHLAAGRLTAGHARAIMTLKDDAHALQLADEVLRRHLSVRDTEHRAREVRRQLQKQAPSAPSRSHGEVALEQRLQSALGTKVRLRQRAGKGRIELHFHSLEHLDELAARLLSH